jgi:Tfp pilus assembly protein PilZ
LSLVVLREIVLRMIVVFDCPFCERIEVLNRFSLVIAPELGRRLPLSGRNPKGVGLKFTDQRAVSFVRKYLRVSLGSIATNGSKTTGKQLPKYFWKPL